MCIILQKNPADHITDHLPFRSIRKQWTGERRRARFSERKGAEKVIFSGNCPYRFVWEQVQAGSTPVIPTKNQPKIRFFAPLSAYFLLIIGFYPPLRQIRLTAEKRLVPKLQHKPLSFFQKAFSLPTAAHILMADLCHYLLILSIKNQPMFVFCKCRLH